MRHGAKGFPRLQVKTTDWFLSDSVHHPAVTLKSGATATIRYLELVLVRYLECDLYEISVNRQGVLWYRSQSVQSLCDSPSF